MFRSRPSEMSFDQHLPFVIDARMVEGILEEFPEPMTGLYLRVQSGLALGSVDGCPDSVVTSRD